MKQKTFWLSLLLLISLSACSLPNFKKDQDPFSQIPAKKIETLYGEVFPFSVSVATKATHRLENDNKLVALLASDIVQLDEFEGRVVEVDGFYRKEKMRPIFWVEAIRVKDLNENPAKLTTRFESKNYSFTIPTNWENSVLEDGSVHFIDKKDPQRKVFLTFKVADISEFDKANDPNIVIANMAGTKKSSTFDSGEIRQEVVLFSNIFPHKKYVFIFNNKEDNFSRKKDFFKLLNSFVEGEEKVKELHEAELKKLAAEELKKVKKDEKNTNETENTITSKAEEENDSLISRILGDKDKTENKENATKKEDSEQNNNDNIVEENPAKISGDFKNMIDSRAYSYTSDYYKFSMKVPYGLWFRNFGPTNNYLDQVGFATYEITRQNEAEMFLNIIADDKPVLEVQKSQVDNELIIEFPKNSQSYFELRGPLKYRDYLKSIQSSITSW